MTKAIQVGRVAEQFRASASTPIPADIHILVQHAVEQTMHSEATRLAVSGDSEGLASLGRSIAVEEGKLLEAVIIALAQRNKDVVVLTGVKLPVLEAAIAIIESNHTGAVGSLTLDPDGRSKRSYYPDLILANRKTQEAIVIDVKRSIASYLGSSKLAELKTRMQAAGLALPDLLWREHNRVAVTQVSVAIIDGSKHDADVSGGIWPLDRLNELVGFPGAGVIAQSAIAAFRHGISSIWTEAIRTQAALPSQPALAIPIHLEPVSQEPVKRGRGRPRKASASAPALRTVTVGLFRPVSRPLH